MLGSRGAAGGVRVVVAVAFLAGAAVIGRAVATGQGDPEAEIRMKRERFNAAVAARDLDALVPIWTEDVRVITSSGGRIEGRDAYRARFAGYFAEREEYRYRREPERVDVYEPWGVATERGRWRARWRDVDGPIDVGGEYLIQWRQTEDGWFVHAELFAPLHCEGGRYCAERP